MPPTTPEVTGTWLSTWLTKSDPALLEAFRRQCETAERNGASAYGIYLMWRGQDGVNDEDLIDISKAVAGE